ncbi:MAG: phosphoglycerate mutase [Verrucomicrobia bacterium]|nr:phosphoglycerate mutase [Verrucomicrobiota bacterium]
MNLPQPQLPRIHLIRHGETEWSLSGRHTSRTEIPLTSEGEDQARRLGEQLRHVEFSRVFTSPRLRARQTCELAGFGPVAEVEAELREWDYGDYEGRTSAEIRAARVDWNLFVDGAAGGETPAQVFARAESFARHLHVMGGNILVFSHGHFLRVLAAAWAGFPVVQARRLGLDPGSLSILAFDHQRADSPIISLWNDTSVSVPAHQPVH